MACDTCFPEQKQRMADRDSLRGQAVQLAAEIMAPVAIYSTPEGTQGIGGYYQIATEGFPIIQVVLPQ